MLSKGEAAYLKAIYEAKVEYGKEITSVKIAEKLKVKPPSALEMIKKLSKKGLLKYSPWKNVEFTKKGLKAAESAIRKHRILESCFVELFKLDRRMACLEASKIDFLISDELANIICSSLNHPKRCPHDKCIPSSSTCCGDVS